MITLFQVFPSYDVTFHRLLFLDTSLRINVSFQSSHPHYCCEKTKSKILNL